MPRLSSLFQVLHVVPDAVRDGRQARRPGRRTPDSCRTGPSRRRVLPVQALLRQLPVHSRAARVEPRLPSPDAACRRDAARQRHQVRPRQGDHPDDGATPICSERSPPPPAPIANKIINAEPGSGVRKAVEKVTGVSSVRLLPPYAKQRFSTWFKKRPEGAARQASGQGRRSSPPASWSTRRPTSAKTSSRSTSATASSAPTRTPAAAAPRGCTRAMSRSSRRSPRRTSRPWPAEVRTGTDIVVPQPTCSYIIKKDYLDYVGGAGCRTRRRTHLRRRRVPDGSPQGRRHVARHRLHRRDCSARSPTTRRVTSGHRTSASRAAT